MNTGILRPARPVRPMRMQDVDGNEWHAIWPPAPPNAPTPVADSGGADFEPDYEGPGLGMLFLLASPFLALLLIGVPVFYFIGYLFFGWSPI